MSFLRFCVLSTEKDMISLGWPSAPRIPQPQPAIASAKPLPNFQTDTLPTKGTLYNASGGIVDRNDDGFSDSDPNNQNFFLFARVTAGTYYVKVEGYNQTTGAYRLGLSTLNVSAAGKPVAEQIKSKKARALFEVASK